MADTPTPSTPPAGDPPPANPDPAAPPSPSSTPPEGEPPAPTERPDWLPETLWTDTGFNQAAFDQYRAPPADLPSAPDAYAVPDKIGEFTTDQIDPAFLGVMRTAAFANGIGQEGFTGILTQYAEAATADADAYFGEQQTALGQNVEARTQQLSTFLDGKLKPEEADAVRAVATNALVFQGLERLMNGAPLAPRDPAPTPATRKTKAEIDALMATKEYSGRADQRNAAVVKEVTDWFVEEDRLQAAKQQQP